MYYKTIVKETMLEREFTINDHFPLITKTLNPILYLWGMGWNLEYVVRTSLVSITIGSWII